MLSSAMTHSNKDDRTKEGVEDLALVRSFTAVVQHKRSHQCGQHQGVIIAKRLGNGKADIASNTDRYNPQSK